MRCSMLVGWSPTGTLVMPGRSISVIVLLCMMVVCVWCLWGGGGAGHTQTCGEVYSGSRVHALQA
jgi:hypothetical protein